MNIGQDIAAVEKFAQALNGMDPAKVFDTALKFMSSTRSRIEAGEKRIADLESTLTTALSTIDKLSGLFGGASKIDFSSIETEIAAMGAPSTAKTTTASTPSVTAIAALVPDADPVHIAAAVDAHVTTSAAGAAPADVKAAAVTAATDAGATDVQAQAIAAAILVAATTTDVTNLPHPDSSATGDITELASSGTAAAGGKTILADGTSV